jgi:hypothetical protein
MAGSTVCKNCQHAIYNRWIKTRVANIIRDQKTHPDAIILTARMRTDLPNLYRSMTQGK